MFGPHWQVIIGVAKGGGCTEGLPAADRIIKLTARD